MPGPRQDHGADPPGPGEEGAVGAPAGRDGGQGQEGEKQWLQQTSNIIQLTGSSKAPVDDGREMSSQGLDKHHISGHD